MRKALGRGLEALFPAGGDRAPLAPSADTTEVAIAEIVPNPEQPRHRFDPEALDALAASLRRHGLLQPLVVRRVAGHYELIAGERRLRAAERAGLERVPVVVRETDPDERLELALVENVQRENLTPIEEAEAYRHLIETQGLTQDEVAARVGKSRPTITNALRLLALPDAVKAQLENGELSAGHARAVLAAGDAAAQTSVAREIAVRGLSKNEAEQLVAARRAVPTRRRPRAAGTADLHLRSLAEELTRGLGTRVNIQRRGRGGKIEIEFYSDAQLDALVHRLRIVSAARGA